jgi:hypothetical protein
MTPVPAAASRPGADDLSARIFRALCQGQRRHLATGSATFTSIRTGTAIPLRAPDAYNADPIVPRQIPGRAEGRHRRSADPGRGQTVRSVALRISVVASL